MNNIFLFVFKIEHVNFRTKSVKFTLTKALVKNNKLISNDEINNFYKRELSLKSVLMWTEFWFCFTLFVVKFSVTRGLSVSVPYSTFATRADCTQLM